MALALSRPRFRILTPLRAVQIALVAWTLPLLVMHAMPPLCYGKDLIQDWLSARGLLDGLSILTPLSELGPRYLPDVGYSPYPSPHPPFVSALFIPLVLFPYPLASAVYLIMSCLAGYLAGRSLGLSPFGALALLAWPPLMLAIDFGWPEPFVLLLVVCAYQADRERRDWKAGLLFGLAAAIKLYPALLVAPYLFRGRRRVVAGSALTFLASWLVDLPFLGFSGLLDYARVLEANAARYSGFWLNAAPLMRFGLPSLAFALVALYLAARRDVKLGGALPLFTLPVVWSPYVLGLIPLSATRLRDGRLYWLVAVLVSLDSVYLRRLLPALESFAPLFVLAIPLGYMLLVALEAVRAIPSISRRSRRTSALSPSLSPRP